MFVVKIQVLHFSQKERLLPEGKVMYHIQVLKLNELLLSQIKTHKRLKMNDVDANVDVHNLLGAF